MLRIRLPELRQAERLMAAARQDLAPHHAAYVRNVSTPEMALSLETSAFILALVRAMRPHAVADLGSGFSSFVLRFHAAEAGSDSVVVHSVDDSAGWLEHTADFLRATGMPTSGLYPWAAYRQRDPAQRFGIVLHDLGDMDSRRDALPFVMRMRATHGVVVLDDMHKKEYAPVARAQFRAAGLHVFQVRRYTLDRLGRFAELAVA